MAATLIVLSIFVLVFLAEVLSGAIENVIYSGLPLSSLPRIIVLTAPEIIILAAPLAMVLGVFRVISTARENSELVGLTAFGVGPLRMIGVLAAFAFAFQLFVLAIAGFVDPLSRLARERMFESADRDLMVRIMREGLARGTTRTIRNVTTVSPAKAPRIFIVERRENQTERLVTADRYELFGPDQASRYRVRLLDVESLDLARPSGERTVESLQNWTMAHENGVAAEPPGAATGPRLLKASTADQIIDVGSALREKATRQSIAFRTLTNLLTDESDLTADRARAASAAAKVLARSSLCVLGLLVALFATSFTSRRKQFVAAPLACMVIVIADIVTIRVVDASAGFSPVEVFAIAAFWILLLWAAGAGLTAERFRSLVRPDGRSG